MDLDVLPKATVPKLMITKLRVSDLTIVLEQTELEAVQAHFGGEIGSEGDASKSLGWLCLHGSDAVGRWVLWLESGEIDGPTVGGFQWRRVPDAVQFDERCRRLPDASSNVEMPIELRLGATGTKVLQILGQPTVSERRYVDLCARARGIPSQRTVYVDKHRDRGASTWRSLGNRSA